MKRQYDETFFYVAPPEPPPSRRPPIVEVGPIGWLRRNLFSSKLNALATVFTAVVVLGFLYLVLSWSIRTAQWAVVYNNLRMLTSGTYDRRETWRLEVVAGALVFLTGLGLGIWARVARSVFIAVLVTLAIIIIVPIISAYIPEPTIHILLQPNKTPPNFVFVGLAGQEVTVRLEPQTDPADVDAPLVGFVEQKSRVDWSTLARQVHDGNVDLSAYNMQFTLRVLDNRLRPLMGDQGPIEAVFDAQNPSGALTFTLPADDWYVLEVTRNDEGGEPIGYAWLRIDNVEIFSSQEDLAMQRVDRFGDPPEVENALFAEEKAYRFEGARSFKEFLSLQLSPLFSRLAVPMLIGVLLFVDGWVIGVLGKNEKRVRRGALIGWALAFPFSIVVLRGFEGSRLLPLVDSGQWGGLLLTVLLTVVGITASFPIGVALALGRRSNLPVIKWTCTLFIETVRGVPLITVLFMAKLIVPFFWSALKDIDLTVRMMIGLTLFSAAYLAENVRGGLQIIPKGQIEAARALGLNPFLTTTLIVLPQALRAVIPAIVGQFISLFKDTSLVALVGLFELVGIVGLIVKGQPIYRPYQREAYIFVAIIYFIISYAMSDVSRRLETSGAGSVRRL